MKEPFGPNDSPAAQFERWEKANLIPERYTRPTKVRPFHPYRDGPAWGLAIVVVGLVGYWPAGMLGWR